MKKILLTLIACFSLISSVFAYETAAPAKFADISLADLKTAIAADKVSIIDVNGTSSYAAGHIPSAIDFAANKATLASLLPADKSALVVAYCSSPKCGAYKKAANAAAQLGYTNVKHFSLGISGWKSAGEPTETAK